MISFKKFISFIFPWFLFALTMNVSRLFFTEIHSYLYLNWNLFLAFLPLFLLYFFEKGKSVFSKTLLFILWLFFLPNAVYIITDFIHLRNVGPEWLLWFDGMMIFSYAFIGIALSSYVILRMQKNIFPEKIKNQKIFIFLLSPLVAFGIYLGRYVRWNSWDLVAHPIPLTKNVFHILVNNFSDKVFLTTILFFSFFILISHYAFRFVFLREKK